MVACRSRRAGLRASAILVACAAMAFSVAAPAAPAGNNSSSSVEGMYETGNSDAELESANGNESHDVGDRTARNSSSRADSTSDNALHEAEDTAPSGTMPYLTIGMIALAVVLLLTALFWTMFGRARPPQGKPGNDSRSREATARQDATGSDFASTAALAADLRNLRQTVVTLARRVELLEGEQPKGAPTGGGGFGGGSDREEYDPFPVRGGRAGPVSRSTPSPASPSPSRRGWGREEGSYATSREATDLIARFNNAKGPADFDMIRDDVAAQNYANDRGRDIARLFPSETDRFWLVVNPENPGEALLLPGFSTKKGWQKFRDGASDNPFAHHFTLTSGDRLIVIRPALLSRSSTGDWELAAKGELSGLQ